MKLGGEAGFAAVADGFLHYLSLAAAGVQVDRLTGGGGQSELSIKGFFLKPALVGCLGPLVVQSDLAEQVGVGAIVVADLSSQRVKDWEFDWDQLLNFQGRSGPYLQYAYVRMGSVLDKYAATFEGAPAANAGAWSALVDEESQDLLRRLGAFPDVVARACEEHEPSVVSRFLLDLAESNNRFYSERRVVDVGDPQTSAARALLTQGVRTVLGAGLSLLGVGLPERM